jgi:uncharacterized membrane protein
VADRAHHELAIAWSLPGAEQPSDVRALPYRAFWFGALLFCCLGVLRPKSGLFGAGRWLLYFGTLSGTVAVASGYLATEAMDHAAPGHDLVHVHRNFMIAAAGLSLVASCVMFALRRSEQRRRRLTQVALLALIVAVAELSADRGAMLVFGYGVGVRAEPPPAATHNDQGEAVPDDHK